MKLLTFRENDMLRFGVRIGDYGVLDVSAAAQRIRMENVPDSVHGAINGGTESLRVLEALVQQVLALAPDERSGLIRDESALALGPCVTNPGKIICVGLNYRKHAEETNAPIPQFPILFNKFSNTLAGHMEDIPIPRVSHKVDYEAELVIVIGKRAKYVDKQDALSHVFGYCNVNDLSARDLQLRTHQWMIGKCCDKFSPLGPYLVTADEVGDPNDLAITCTVNGEVRQSSHTSDMIFRCDEIVSYISQHMTLEPGDIILTGTPEGVVLGYPEEKQIYLKPGDTVSIEIEKLGRLTNRMVEEAIF
jgi:2-keto-4-pentenoate hydratase/2-oxohepta-3-ene-1,7-dioic acid hydratase in catechol pathway